MMDLSHIVLKTENLDESIAFYQKLGFFVLYNTGDHALMQSDNTNILLKTYGKNKISFYDNYNKEKYEINDPDGNTIEIVNTRIERYTFPPISCGTVINSDIKNIWNTFVNPNGWDNWFTEGMSMEVKTGGEIFFRWVKKTYGEEVTDYGFIHELIPEEKIVFSWNKYGKIYKSKVKMKFYEASEGGFWVYIEDDLLVMNEEDIKMKLDCAVGWGEMLTLAKLYIEKGITLF